MVTKIGDVWYRYDDKRYASFDSESDVAYAGATVIEESKFVVVKLTPKGAWVQRVWGDPTAINPATQLCGKPSFVLFGDGKRKAHPSKERALASLVARKTRQASIYATRLKDAEAAKQLAKYELSKLMPGSRTDSADLERLLHISKEHA